MRHGDAGDVQDYMELSESRPASPTRALMESFDIVDVGRYELSPTTVALGARGFRVGPRPPSDLRAYNDFIDWVMFLISTGRTWGVFVPLSSRTWSRAERPRVRTAQVPWGLDPSDSDTMAANVLMRTLLAVCHTVRGSQRRHPRWGQWWCACAGSTSLAWAVPDWPLPFSDAVILCDSHPTGPLRGSTTPGASALQQTGASQNLSRSAPGAMRRMQWRGSPPAHRRAARPPRRCRRAHRRCRPLVGIRSACLGIPANARR